jgi:hypothetical protein
VRRKRIKRLINLLRKLLIIIYPVLAKTALATLKIVLSFLLSYG